MKTKFATKAIGNFPFDRQCGSAPRKSRDQHGVAWKVGLLDLRSSCHQQVAHCVNLRNENRYLRNLRKEIMVIA